MFAATSRCASMKPLVNRVSLAHLRQRRHPKFDMVDVWEESMSNASNIWGERAVKAVEGLPKDSSFCCGLDGKLMRFCLHSEGQTETSAELRLLSGAEAPCFAQCQRRIASLTLSSSSDVRDLEEKNITVVGIRRETCFMRASISSMGGLTKPTEVQFETMYGDIFAIFSNFASRDSEEIAVDKAIQSLIGFSGRRRERQFGRSGDATTLEEAAEDVLLDSNARECATVMLGIVTDPRESECPKPRNVPPPEFTSRR
mmetsp:Transcript_52440/g.60251  ORF Transcript_52440/g.60251 Transcript_52440/m.60251 type:complete len:257 (+) Transcript_52440:101-871(+)